MIFSLLGLSAEFFEVKGARNSPVATGFALNLVIFTVVVADRINMQFLDPSGVEKPF